MSRSSHAFIVYLSGVNIGCPVCCKVIHINHWLFAVDTIKSSYEQDIITMIIRLMSSNALLALAEDLQMVQQMVFGQSEVAMLLTHPTQVIF